MNYKKIKTLLSDSAYVSALLSYLRIQDETEQPINEEASAAVTEVFDLLSSNDGTFFHTVKVIGDPDQLTVESADKRIVYTVITVIPDIPFAYTKNFATVEIMALLGLQVWEKARTVMMASRNNAVVHCNPDPEPPILNSADVKRVCL